ncbi:unnamed protein product [Didymodactylos carnosus]|uniref:Uncharacterized protein n=1 Tax=Didymodactylos carnosus TaxID=1234261 RepID=A0A814RNP5_9BILA|nr:unnamed protein product [Didymodactylos carnosus]CAF3900199.1 unnamed protein product [Didymodactylos carnosus]
MSNFCPSTHIHHHSLIKNIFLCCITNYKNRLKFKQKLLIGRKIAKIKLMINNQTKDVDDIDFNQEKIDHHLNKNNKNILYKAINNNQLSLFTDDQLSITKQEQFYDHSHHQSCPQCKILTLFQLNRSAIYINPDIQRRLHTLKMAVIESEFHGKNEQCHLHKDKLKLKSITNGEEKLILNSTPISAKR